MNNKILATSKITTVLRKFAIPSIVALVVSALYNIVDQIFIGNSELGYLGNAAASIVFPAMVLMTAFAWCFGDGLASLMSIRQGKKDTKTLDRSVGNTLFITVAISLVLLLIFIFFLEPILNAFGATAQTLPLASSYFRIILIMAPVFMAGSSLISAIRADGSPTFSMLVIVVGAIINTILDPIFIYAFHWGIEGAAIATIIGQLVSCLVAFYYVFFRAKTFKLKPSSFKPSAQVIWEFTKLGISTFISQLSIVLTSLVCNLILVKYGELSKFGADIPIAATGIAMKVFAIIINIVVGLSLGAQPLLGYNLGAGNFERVRKTFTIVMYWTIGISMAAFLIFELCPELVIGIFGSTSDPLYIEYSVLLFRVFFLLMVANCVSKVIAMFFQFVGQPVKSTIVALARDVILFAPLCLILPGFMGIEGVLWASPIADGISVVFAIALIVHYFKKLGHGQKALNAVDAALESEL